MPSSRERVLKTIRFECPDRIPVTYSFTGALYKYGEKVIEIIKKFPNDFYTIEDLKVPVPRKEFYRHDGTYYRETTDEWGVKWMQMEEGMSGQAMEHPLSDWSRLKDYRLPPPPLSEREARERQKEEFKKIKDTYVAWGTGGALWEWLRYLRGFEDLLMDIFDDREEVYRLADRIVDEYMVPAIEANIEAGADVMGFGDDWGTQGQLMIAPHLFRRIFKPRYGKMFSICREAGVLIWMHSDGAIMDIVPDLIEIGVNVLNPQFSCMDLKKMRRITGGRICICSDIDRQSVLPFGKPEDVREYVKGIYDLLAMPEGGLIWNADLSSSGTLENIRAVLSAFREFKELPQPHAEKCGTYHQDADG